jgi:hypothetical protein
MPQEFGEQLACDYLDCIRVERAKDQKESPDGDPRSDSPAIAR